MDGFFKAIIAIFLIWPDLLGLSAQEAVLTSGGDALGGGGTVSFSVGQPAYTSHEDAGGTVSLGVQQVYLTIMVATEEPEPEISFGLYPNPVRSELQLNLATTGTENIPNPYAYSLFDLAGKLVIQGDVTGKVTNVSVDGLNEGIYFLEVRRHGTPVKTFKVIKTN